MPKALKVTEDRAHPTMIEDWKVYLNFTNVLASTSRVFLSIFYPEKTFRARHILSESNRLL